MPRIQISEVIENVYTYPVFALSNLEHTEFLTACAFHDLSLDFIVDHITFRPRLSIFPVYSE